MKGKRYLSVFVSLAVLFALGGCKGNNSTGSGESSRATASIKVGFNAKTRNLIAKSATVVVGTVSEIAAITVDVQNGSTTIVQGAPLTNNGGAWSATINDLPVGEMLTLTGHAFNSSSAEIFTGMTSQVLTGINDEVLLVMAPVMNNATLQFPSISQISRPVEIILSSVAPVSVSVQGSSGETLSYEITPAADGGTFSPSSGSITLSGSAATIVFSYTAPGSTGTYTHSIKVTNSLGNSTETTFDTNVASQVTGSAVVVQFNPVITALSAVRNGSDVTFTASVSDAGPSGELAYNWSFDGGLSFADAAANPAVLQGYEVSASGTLSLTVMNGSGGSTTVFYALNRFHFPRVSSMMLLPQTAITTGIEDCRNGAVSGNIIALDMEENGNHRDYNNDGDMDDEVLGYYDITQRTMVNTGIAIGQSVAIDGDIMAFQFAGTGTLGWYSISAQTQHDTGITPDGFGRDTNGPTRVISNGRIAYVSGGELNIYDTASQQITPTGVQVADSRSLSFSAGVVAFTGPAGTIGYYDVDSGQTVDTGIQGSQPAIDNGIIVFNTPARQVAYYDISKGVYVLTPILPNTDSASISNGIIVAFVHEDNYWGDLNGSGVIGDDDQGILVLYDIATGRMISTGLKVCCGPDISGLVIAFEMYEPEVNMDLDGDGDISDCVQVYVTIDELARQYFGR